MLSGMELFSLLRIEDMDTSLDEGGANTYVSPHSTKTPKTTSTVVLPPGGQKRIISPSFINVHDAKCKL